MTFTFSTYRLEVDVEATRAWYAAQTLPGVTCDCAGCRNFLRAADAMPAPVRDFLCRLGADPLRPAELCYYSGTPEKLYGGGWYHICGRILEGAVPPGSRQAFGEWLELAEGFSAAFKPECDLLAEDFPRPCFQMELNHCYPWVLAEANPYAEET